MLELPFPTSNVLEFLRLHQSEVLSRKWLGATMIKIAQLVTYAGNKIKITREQSIGGLILNYLHFFSSRLGKLSNYSLSYIYSIFFSSSSSSKKPTNSRNSLTSISLQTKPPHIYYNNNKTARVSQPKFFISFNSKNNGLFISP